MAKILVTGAAGFIGFHLCKRLLLEKSHQVVGLDNLNDYYDVNLKKARLHELYQIQENFLFYQENLANKEAILEILKQQRFDIVINLAAQAGVPYAIKNPYAYLESNLSGFLNILEGCRHFQVKHLVFASSSSVYGANKKMPFSVHDNVDHPLSLYAASKKANELMAHSYSNLYQIPATGLRFFTVYGPWGRPDMALFIFTKAILEGRPIEIFNHGKLRRDFTYIDDIVEGIVRVMAKVPQGDPSWSGEAPDPGSSYAPYKIYNIGNHKPVDIMEFIAEIEKCLGKKAEKQYLPPQPGDVEATYADIEDLFQDVGFSPNTSIEEGIARFVEWYREYYRV